MGFIAPRLRALHVPSACVLGLGLGVALLEAQQSAARASQLTPLPLTQLDDRTFSAELDNRTFVWTFAQPVLINDLLLLLVRGTSLSVVPDSDISGSIVGELKNVTVRQALDLILPQLVTGVTGGWFGRSNVLTRKRFELVILLTPKILAPAGAD